MGKAGWYWSSWRKFIWNETFHKNLRGTTDLSVDAWEHQTYSAIVQNPWAKSSMLIKCIWMKLYIQIIALHYWVSFTNAVIEMCFVA